MPDLPQRPFSIRIFVPDGNADGLRLVEKSNWTGVGVVFNRGIYKQVASRPEFGRTGVYVVIGGSEESAMPTIYVGEGDPVKDRLNQHYVKKDFWDWGVFFVTKDGSLNKAHVQHLETRLLELARTAKQCNLDNEQIPTPPTLSEAERADVDSFLLDMLSIFPLLGLGVFEKTEMTQKPTHLLYLEAKGIKASGYEDAKGFVVCEGSQLVKQETQMIHNYMSTLRKDFVTQGVVVENGQHYIFTQDQVFGSPSTAAGVILGRAANGRIEWKTKDGRTLKQIQTAAAGEAGHG
ncbi:MAG: GIY-YIG nuclease family protein [Planctomycetia bacterium]|nr:GIY-YIG nuclease family protein [Planctomycetia bacterium]